MKVILSSSNVGSFQSNLMILNHKVMEAMLNQV